MSSVLLLTSCGSNPIADIANSIDSCKTVMSAAGAYSDAAMTLLENPSDQAALDKLKSLGSDLSALAGKVNDPDARRIYSHSLKSLQRSIRDISLELPI